MIIDDQAHFPEVFFTWWNAAMKKAGETSETEFGRFFASDAEIITNEKTVCKGVSEITRHFMRVRIKTTFCEVRLPMERTISAGNHIFVHYLIDAASESERQLVAVMGYMQIDSGKIQVSRQLQHILETVPE